MKIKTILAVMLSLIIAVPQILAHNIFDAIKKNDIKLVEKIIADDPSKLNAQDKYDLTPLNLSIIDERIETAKLLLSKGAKINTKSREGLTPLHFIGAKICRIKNDLTEIAKLLLSKGADINAKDNYNQTPLHYATQNGHTKITKFFIDNGANVNTEGFKKKSPLHHAAKDGYILIAKLLIENNALVNVDDEHGKTPLHYAVIYGHKAIAELLINNNAKINAQDKFCNTPLYGAIENKYVNIIKLLLSKGANINATNNYEKTSLHLAIIHSYRKITQLLLSKGANINAKDTFGKMPFYYAKERNHTKIVTLLEMAHKNQTKLESALVELKKNSNRNIIAKIDNLILDKQTPSYPKIKTIEELIQAWKKDNSLIEQFKIKKYINQIPFNYDSLSSPAIIEFILDYKYSVVDMNKRDVEKALCLYPTCEAIPFIFSRTEPNQDLINKLLQRAKNLNLPKYGCSLVKAICTRKILDSKESKPFPPEIVGTIISFMNF